MENINKQFIEIKYKMLRKEKLEMHKQDLEDRLEHERSALVRLAHDLQKEEADVKKLHKASISSILSKISGGQEYLLEKEQGDAVRAALDYKQKQSDIEFMEYELKILLNELKCYDDLDSDLEAVIEIKRKMMPKEMREQIKIMEQKRQKAQLNNKEIKEAKEAGQRLLSSLLNLLENLNDYMNEASDPFFSYPAHENLDEIMKESSKLKECWEIFQKEMDDTDMDTPKLGSIDLLQTFSECLFYVEDDQDLMLDKAKQSYKQLNLFYGEIKRSISQLDKAYQDNLFQISDLGLDIQKAIEEN